MSSLTPRRGQNHTIWNGWKWELPAFQIQIHQMNFSFTHWRSCVQNVLVFNFDQIQRIDFAGVLSGSDTFRKRKSEKWPSRGKTLHPSSSQRAGLPCLIRFSYNFYFHGKRDLNLPPFKDKCWGLWYRFNTYPGRLASIAHRASSLQGQRQGGRDFSESWIMPNAKLLMPKS